MNYLAAKIIRLNLVAKIKKKEEKKKKKEVRENENGKIKKEEENKGCNNWSHHLPPDFISSLLHFLSPKSRCAFQATCKSWRNALESSPCYSSPTLMLTNIDIAPRFKFYHPASNEYFHLGIDQQDYDYLKDATVHCSNYGWLLMSREFDVFFFNTFTKHKIQLPKSCMKFSAMCFTYPPTSSDFEVFGFHETVHRFAVMRSGETWKRWVVWDLIEYVCIDIINFSTNSPILFQGLYYCLGGAANFVVCDLHHEHDSTFTFHDTKFSETEKRQVRQTFLLEMDGKLVGIFLPSDRKGIMVRWLDIERWEWHPVDAGDMFRDKVLYLSCKGSFVQCDDTTKDNGNKIYFPNFCGEIGVYYSLNTGKYHAVKGEFSSTSSWLLEEFLEFGAWISPTAASRDFGDWQELRVTSEIYESSLAIRI